jgi:hypothetical protein
MTGLMTEFLKSVEPLMVSFLMLVVPALGLWIVQELNKNRQATQQAANSAQAAANSAEAANLTAVTHNASVTDKLNSVSKQMDGINSGLTDKVDQQNIAALADKDRQIAVLTKKINGSQTQGD